MVTYLKYFSGVIILEIVFIIILIIGFIFRKKIARFLKNNAGIKIPIEQSEETIKPPEKIVVTDENDALNVQHRNIPRVLDEPQVDEKKRHLFPPQTTPATRYEDFCHRLFVVTHADETKKWPPTQGNDYPTYLEGENTDIIKEMKERLRPYHPVLYDHSGLWDETAQALEIDPYFENIVTKAYLKMQANRRPCVISAKPKKKTDSEKEESIRFTLYRYGYEPFHIDGKYFSDAPAELLHMLLLYLTSKNESYESLSPARLRYSVLSKIKEEEEEASAMNDYQKKRDAERYNNRFAALWKLRDNDTKKSKSITETKDA